jgi:hypothetical protein
MPRSRKVRLEQLNPGRWYAVQGNKMISSGYSALDALAFCDGMGWTVTNRNAVPGAEQYDHEQAWLTLTKERAQRCTCPPTTKRGRMRFAPRSVDCPVHGELSH